MKAVNISNWKEDTQSEIFPTAWIAVITAIVATGGVIVILAYFRKTKKKAKGDKKWRCLPRKGFDKGNLEKQEKVGKKKVQLEYCERKKCSL